MEIHPGHDDNGKAMIASDTVLTPANPLDPPGSSAAEGYNSGIYKPVQD